MTTTTEGVSEFAVLAETMEAPAGFAADAPRRSAVRRSACGDHRHALSGVAFRYGLSRPIVWIDESRSIASLWLAMLGSADCDRPLRASAADHSSQCPRAKGPGSSPETLGMVAIMAFLLVLLPAAYTYAAGEMDITSSALNIPRAIVPRPLQSAWFDGAAGRRSLDQNRQAVRRGGGRGILARGRFGALVADARAQFVRHAQHSDLSRRRCCHLPRDGRSDRLLLRASRRFWFLAFHDVDAAGRQ